MSKKVLKYSLELKSDVVNSDAPVCIMMPVRAQILSIGVQTHLVNQIQVWALVDDESGWVEWKYFYIVGTGVAAGFLNNNIKFVGTVQTPVGEVYHVFVT